MPDSDSKSNPAASHCDNCGKPIVIPPSALNKRFCSASCRMEWHQKQRELWRKVGKEHEEALARARQERLALAAGSGEDDKA